MPGPLQKFIAAATKKAAGDLITAVENLPEDKRSWSPLDKGRTALDQAAECAILNGSVINLLKTKVFPTDFNYDEFVGKKAELAKDWNAVKELLLANTELAIAAIEAVPDSELDIEVAMPWGTHTVASIMSYPYWNMSYHEGQTNYIGFLAA
jgi:hypothetical protein